MGSGNLDMRLKQEGRETRLVWMKCTDLGQEPEQVHPSASSVFSATWEGRASSGEYKLGWKSESE